MSQLNVDNIQNRTGSNGGPNFPSGISVAVGQTAYIHGNLQVDGTETIINTETLNVADKTVGIGSTSNASNTTADGSGIEVFASSSQVGNNKTLTWGNTSNSWEFGPNDVGLKVGTGVTVYGGTGIVSATSFKGDGSLLTGIDATAIQTGNTSVQTVDTGSDGHVKMTTEGGERVRVGPAGQIGLGGANYGTSGQLLTSSGSGSAPTWTTVSSAPTIELVADGAIAANTSVIVTSDGKAKSIVGYSDGIGSEIDVATIANTSFAHSSVAEDPSTGRVVYLYNNTAVNPNATYYRVGTRIGSNITWGTAASIQDGACDGGVTQIVNIGADKFFALYRSQGDEHYYTRVLTTTSSNTATKGTQVVMTDTSNNNLTDVRLPQLQHNTETGAILGIYGQGAGANTGIIGRMWTVSGTTITRGAPVQLRSNVCETMDATWMQYKKTMVAVYRWNNNQFNYSLILEPASGTTVTYHNGNITSSTGGNHMVVFDNTNNVVHAVYQHGSTSRYTYYAGVWQASGSTGTISWGSGTYLEAGGANIPGNYDYGKMIYQPNAKKYLFIGQQGNNGNRVTFSPGGTLGGTNQTLVSATAPTQFSTSFNQRNYMMKVGGSGTVLIPYGYSSNQYLRVRQYESTTLTSENFVGFSDGTSYTNGQTVTINIVGNTSTQSSLTVANVYYVQANGTLGTTAATPSVVAGRALSSTKLLIQPV